MVAEVHTLFKYLEALRIEDYCLFDPSLARGLDYYTGMIFEGVLQGKDATYGIGSIAGGGRYDNLIGMFSRNPIPSVGGCIGIERIFNILEERAKEEKRTLNTVDVVVGVIGNVSQEVVLETANWLWDGNIKTEIFYEQQKPGE